MKDIHETLNDLLGHSAETEKFFTHMIEQKRAQIEAYKIELGEEIEHVKARYGRELANAEKELDNFYLWAKALGLRQVIVDTGGLKNGTQRG